MGFFDDKKRRARSSNLAKMLVSMNDNGTQIINPAWQHGEPKRSLLRVRISDQELNAVREKAEAAGYCLSEFVRLVLEESVIKGESE